nr:retrovirus-related Pol polyprotein from transposon TNT 1-94 [Tanacetum cinerariifolium]
MFKINPSQTPRVDLVPNKQSSASIRTNPINNSQRHVIVNENVSSNTATASFIGLVHTTKTRRPQPKGNTRNARVPSTSKSSEVKKIVVQICLWCVDSGCSKHMTKNIKLLINFVWKFLGTVHFGNDNIAAILGYEVTFRRNTCFIRDLDGVDLLKSNRSINLYTINLYDMASASPICLMARATPTKSWLWNQRLSHINFDTINDLAKNDLISGLPNFKYAKEHLCPSCEQGKSKRASHPPKLVPNSKHQLHLLHMDLCGLMRFASINGKRVYNRRTRKIMETMNVTFDELSVTAFEQNSSRPGLQSMTSRQISFELELTYASSIITPQRPRERDLDILFEPLHNDYLGGRPAEAP